MRWRKLLDVVTAMLAMAYLTGSARQDFRDFEAANPGSGLKDYLIDWGLSAWPWVLGTIGAIALIAWWNRLKGAEPVVLVRPRPLRTGFLILLVLVAGVFIGFQNWLPTLAITVSFWLIVIARLSLAPADDPVARQELRSR